MTFQPVIPTAGYAGWAFLNRTLDKQSAAHARTPAGQRDEVHFRKKIGQIETAAELVADRRLLRVALTAFGLEEDLPNRAFITKVLESPTNESRSFVNRLADKRYLDFAKTFGFAEGDQSLRSRRGFADSILESFRARRFEAAVGEQDESMRLALALKRDLPSLASGEQSGDTLWYRVLGTPSLRQVFETAFALPKSFGALDIDRQVETLKTRTSRMFGESTLRQFSDPDKLDRLLRRFFVGEQLNQSAAATGQSVALSLLQAASVGLSATRSHTGR